jgi:ribose/xylose/arabinose/galactoside ABC-type transport system permease subunit
VEYRPTRRRVALSTLALFLLWGLTFGWIDGDIWTTDNWIEALTTTATFFVAMYLILWLKSRDANPRSQRAERDQR